MLYRTIVFCLVITFHFLAAPAQSDDFFEGVVTFQMSRAGKVSGMKHYMQGSKMRMEIGGGSIPTSIGIADYDKEKLYMIMPQTSMYMEMDINLQDLTSSANSGLQKAEVTKTNETEEILGYTCTKWISKQNNQSTDMWIAKGFGKFYQPDIGDQNSPLGSMRKELEAEGGFPFRIVQKDQKGTELFKMEVTKVDKRPLESELFKVPPNYKKFNMPAGGLGKNH